MKRGFLGRILVLFAMASICLVAAGCGGGIREGVLRDNLINQTGDGEGADSGSDSGSDTTDTDSTETDTSTLSIILFPSTNENLQSSLRISQAALSTGALTEVTVQNLEGETVYESDRLSSTDVGGTPVIVLEVLQSDLLTEDGFLGYVVTAHIGGQEFKTLKIVSADEVEDSPSLAEIEEVILGGSRSDFDEFWIRDTRNIQTLDEDSTLQWAAVWADVADEEDPVVTESMKESYKVWTGFRSVEHDPELDSGVYAVWHDQLAGCMTLLEGTDEAVTADEVLEIYRGSAEVVDRIFEDCGFGKGVLSESYNGCSVEGLDTCSAIAANFPAVRSAIRALSEDENFQSDLATDAPAWRAYAEYIYLGRYDDLQAVDYAAQYDLTRSITPEDWSVTEAASFASSELDDFLTVFSDGGQNADWADSARSLLGAFYESDNGDISTLYDELNQLETFNGDQELEVRDRFQH